MRRAVQQSRRAVSTPLLAPVRTQVGEPELTERLGTIRAMPGTTPQSAHQAMQEYVAEVLRRLNHRCAPLTTQQPMMRLRLS